MSASLVPRERYFVDTNVLVYARDATEPEKQALARAWLGFLWATRQGRTGMQVLQEYYQVVTRKLTPGLDPVLARADIRDLGAWRPVGVDEAVMEKAWAVEDGFRVSWWDALIVAAAQHGQCHYLLTEDLQHGQDLGGLIALNPFTEAPPPIPAPGKGPLEPGPPPA